MPPQPDRSQAGVRPLRVIAVNDFAAVTGGTDRVAITEAVGLARRGHQVTFLAGQGETDPDLIEAGVTVRMTGQQTTLEDPNPIRAGARGIWNRRAAALVRETTASADPTRTVVHVHGFTKVMSASSVRAAVSSRLPVVATLHDYFAACPNGGFFNYQTNEICRLRPLSAQCIASNCDARAYSHKLWRVGRSAVQRTFGAMPAGVADLIAPSGFTADILRPFLPPTAHIHIVPNPVPVERLPAVDLSDNATFLFLGRLSPDKGPVVFARAAKKANVHAVFAGTGPEAAAVRLANPEAELAGWLAPERVQLAVRGARAVVSSSLWYETQGLAALEAAANGVPAIVSDVSVLREVVIDDETGLWFRGGDEDDLAEKLSRLAQDAHLATRLGNGAYARFWSGRWDLETHLDLLERIYYDAIDPSR